MSGFCETNFIKYKYYLRISIFWKFEDCERENRKSLQQLNNLKLFKNGGKPWKIKGILNLMNFKEWEILINLFA